jgi:hypothetical protein
MVRTLRKAVEAAIPVIGILIVLGAVLFLIDPSRQIPIVILGLLIVEAGVWGLARPLLPSERKYYALREETDRFIGLVRRLNTAAIERDEDGSAQSDQAFDAVHSELRFCLERIVAAAGKTDEQVRRPPVLST